MFKNKYESTKIVRHDTIYIYIQRERERERERERGGRESLCKRKIYIREYKAISILNETEVKALYKEE